LIPITDAMKSGKEPMRTFGDLMQFYQGRPEVTAAPPEGSHKPQAAVDEAPPPAGEAPAEVTPPVAPQAPSTPPEKAVAPPAIDAGLSQPEETGE
jgi:protein Tex